METVEEGGKEFTEGEIFYIRTDINGPTSGLLTIKDKEYYFLSQEKAVGVLNKEEERNFDVFNLDQDVLLKMKEEQQKLTDWIGGYRNPKKFTEFKYTEESVTKFSYSFPLNAEMGEKIGFIKHTNISNYYSPKEI